jgi:hypothetical protein
VIQRVHVHPTAGCFRHPGTVARVRAFKRAVALTARRRKGRAVVYVR